MTPRNRFLITAALLCHSLLGPPLVTSQLLSSKTNAATQENSDASRKGDAQKESDAPELNTPCAKQAAAQAKDLPTICAIQQEMIGALYKLHGSAEIHYGTYILRADEVAYDSDTGEASASGHFRLDGGPNDDHIRATHGTYNLIAETGRFYDVTGTTGLRFSGNRVILTSTSPFSFTGKIVEKTTPEHYLVYDGTITTCALPHPRWKYEAHKVVVDVGGNATIYNSTFLLHGLPVLYFPFATYPVDREARETGFLIPTVGKSSTRGNIVGDAFYWAINRSMDGILGAEYLSKRGWSQRGEYRARPSDTSYVDLTYYGVIDRQQQGGEEAKLNAEGNFHGFRAVSNIDYLSSFLFRLAFNDVFTQAVYSEVKSQAFLSKSLAGFTFSGMVERYQNYQSTTPGDVITISHAPSFDVSGVDQRLGRSPLYWSFDASEAGLARSEPGFRTANLLGRFDLNPRISLPLLFRGWSVRSELALHDTFYTAQLVPGLNGGVAVNDSLNRHALETSVELRPPALQRIFDTEYLGQKWKHVIEPFAAYRLVTGVNDFSHVLRFDERDILSNTHEVEYGVVNRLYAKRKSNPAEECSGTMQALLVGGAAPEAAIPWQHTTNQKPPCLPGPQVREVATWEIAQKYFLDPAFGGALVPGQRNVFTTTADLTGIAFLTEPRHLSPIVSRLRVQTSDRTDTEWDLDYDFQLGRINASTLLVNYHAGPFTIGGGDAFLRIPLASASPFTLAAAQEFQQFRVALGYGKLNKPGFSAATSFGIDSDTGLLQFATAQTTYDWDCCGMTVEYRRYAIANVRNENLFRFTFTLANIGSFGNLRRQERLY
ncbi:MAG TPA: LPS assembly protein LptD [Candidatus Sulfotelmatobacter sp.]|nr:LPS assembly protein LptD [Candidatus Sulfotelmatobacter sp.]